MAVTEKVKQFLDEQGVTYETVSHMETFSSSAEAKAVGVMAGHVAKTLVIKTHDGDVLAVLPASKRIDIHKLRDLVGDKHARLATEQEMGNEFSEFELGAIPPLGGLFDMPVFLDKQLESAGEILFTGGTHRDSVKISGEDFLKLVRPLVVDLVRDEEVEGLY